MPRAGNQPGTHLGRMQSPHTEAFSRLSRESVIRQQMCRLSFGGNSTLFPSSLPSKRNSHLKMHLCTSRPKKNLIICKYKTFVCRDAQVHSRWKAPVPGAAQATPDIPYTLWKILGSGSLSLPPHPALISTLTQLMPHFRVPTEVVLHSLCHPGIPPTSASSNLHSPNLSCSLLLET